ncbi:Uncharacterized protein FKW44_016256, partial [Caligus rogercresseyi]
RLNMNDFNKITAALTSMQLENKLSPRSAPLATSEDIDQGGYAGSSENVKKSSLISAAAAGGSEYAQPLDQQQAPPQGAEGANGLAGGRQRERLGKLQRRRKQYLKALAEEEPPSKEKGVAIPVATPKVPPMPTQMPPRLLAKDPTKSPTIEPDRGKEEGSK